MNLLRFGSRCALFPRIGSAQNTRRFIHLSSLLDKLVQFKLSDIGEGIAEVQIKDWHVKVGDKVEEFDEICLVQSDKASVTITSRYQGVIKKLCYKVDDIAKVGQPLIEIDVEKGAEDEESEESPPSSEIKEPSESKSSHEERSDTGSNAKSNDPDRVLAAPAVRKLVRENNLDASKISGTGKDGRLLKEDILNFLDNKSSSDSGRKQCDKRPVHQEHTRTPSEDRIVPIRGYGRAMVKSMTESLKIPHFGYDDEYSMDKLIEARQELNRIGEKRGIKCSYMPLIIKATSLALSQFPIVNSSLDERMENVIYKSSHNISLAMDTPGGLVVPNIKNCNHKSVWEIAAELDRLLKLGKEQKFSKEDLIDGTFSISNIGAVGGGTYVCPVIFAPQVAIAALGRVQKLPRFDADGELVAQSIINFSFAADHRVVDGATMARFSNALKEYIENPASMVGDLR